MEDKKSKLNVVNTADEVIVRLAPEDLLQGRIYLRGDRSLMPTTLTFEKAINHLVWMILYRYNPKYIEGIKSVDVAWEDGRFVVRWKR